MEPNPTLLSHLDADARPRMVDVGGKTATDRVAHAQARVRFPPEVAHQLREAGFVLPKGAVLTVAHIAGVMGAKITSQLIPLCHPLALQRCDITIDMDGDSAVIDFLGQPQVEIRSREQVVTTTISAAALAAHRARFPAMLDADAFTLGGPISAG